MSEAERLASEIETRYRRGFETQEQAKQPLTDEQKAVLQEARLTAMKWAGDARIPEAGAFGGIAQDLDWLCWQLSFNGIKGE